MRLAIISDIHSNFEALEAVMAQVRQESVDAVLNLGDLVGYNASPNECLELLLSQDFFNLAGNHDLALLDPERAESFNIIAHQALMWSREQIRPGFLKFLQTLPLTQELGGRFLACHGTPTSADTYISYHFQGKRVFKQMSKQAQLKVCFFGHTHRRALWYRDIRGTVGSREITRPKMDQSRQRGPAPGWQSRGRVRHFRFGGFFHSFQIRAL
jgi:predicted phosphodiesterase